MGMGHNNQVGVFYFLESSCFHFTVFKQVDEQTVFQVFQSFVSVWLCGLFFFVEVYPMQYLLMKYINLLLDPIAGQRRICLVDIICMLFLYTVVMETVKLKDPEGWGA